METSALVSYVIKGALILAMIYYMVYPEKARLKKTTDVKRVRLLLGLSILILASTTFMNYALNRNAPTENSFAADNILQTLKNKLTRYSEEIRKDPLTLACSESNQKDILNAEPKMDKELVETLSLVSCSCILESYKDTPEFQKTKDLMTQGKTFGEAFHETIEASPDFEEKTKHCAT